MASLGVFLAVQISIVRQGSMLSQHSMTVLSGDGREALNFGRTMVWSSMFEAVSCRSMSTLYIATISKQDFCLVGMAPSEWMCPVRAIRDTPVLDYSERGFNTMSRVSYRPPISVLPFLLTLSGSYYKRTLWR